MKDASAVLKELDVLRDELFPLARRATMLYSVLRSLGSIQREYQFTLPFFLKLFDEAVGGEFPEGFLDQDDSQFVSDSLIRNCIHGMLAHAGVI